MRTEAPTLNEEMTIRRLDLDQRGRAAATRLAELDSHPPLAAPVIGIEAGGELLAAASLADSELVSDPFKRTAELRSLLGLRLRQLRRRRAKARLRRRLAFPSGHSARVGGSPAGEIIRLPRWN